MERLLSIEEDSLFSVRGHGDANHVAACYRGPKPMKENSQKESPHRMVRGMGTGYSMGV